MHDKDDGYDIITGPFKNSESIKELRYKLDIATKLLTMCLEDMKRHDCDYHHETDKSIYILVEKFLKKGD